MNEWDRLFVKLRDWKKEYEDIEEYTVNINKKELECLLNHITKLDRKISEYRGTIGDFVDILEDKGWIEY